MTSFEQSIMMLLLDGTPRVRVRTTYRSYFDSYTLIPDIEEPSVNVV